jgi:hypothetical protein
MAVVLDDRRGGLEEAPLVGRSQARQGLERSVEVARRPLRVEGARLESGQLRARAVGSARLVLAIVAHTGERRQHHGGATAHAAQGQPRIGARARPLEQLRVEVMTHDAAQASLEQIDAVVERDGQVQRVGELGVLTGS